MRLSTTSIAGSTNSGRARHIGRSRRSLVCQVGADHENATSASTRGTIIEDRADRARRGHGHVGEEDAEVRLVDAELRLDRRVGRGTILRPAMRRPDGEAEGDVRGLERRVSGVEECRRPRS